MARDHLGESGCGISSEHTGAEEWLCGQLNGTDELGTLSYYGYCVGKQLPLHTDLAEFNIVTDSCFTRIVK